jgi:hypothetical protein
VGSDPAREGGINLLRGAVACSNSASSSTDGAKADPATSKPATASSAVTRIAADVHPAELSGKVTAANDPNYLLGRPSQYASKVTFTDTRIKPSDVSVAEKGPSNAGERSKLFADASDAKARAEYIQNVTKSMSARAMLRTCGSALGTAREGRTFPGDLQVTE